MQYQVVCTHNRHVAIVIAQTPKVTQFLAVRAVGVVNEKMPTSAFNKEYSIQMSYSATEAAVKFLSAAIRGYVFNEQAILNLKDIIMSDNNEVSKEVKSLLALASTPTSAQLAAAEKKAEKAAKVKAAKPVTEPKPRGLGIGAFCVEQINAGKTNKEILEAVIAKWPEAKTTVASLAWYRNDIKKAAKNG